MAMPHACSAWAETQSSLKEQHSQQRRLRAPLSCPLIRFGGRQSRQCQGFDAGLFQLAHQRQNLFTEVFDFLLKV